MTFKQRIKMLKKSVKEKVKKALKWSRPQEFLSPISRSRLGNVITLPAGARGNKMLIDIYFDLLCQLKPNSFFDIGANKGEASQRARIQCKIEHVFAFEANAKIHQMYAEKNREYGISWYNVAVSNTTGKATLFIPRRLERKMSKGRFKRARVVEPEDTGKSSLLDRNERSVSDRVDVDTTSLDEFIGSLGIAPEHALWIDVEGAGAFVLQGAKQTLQNTRLLLIEVEGYDFWKNQYLVSDIVDMLAESDFIPVLRDQEYFEAQFNIIFLKKNDTDLLNHLQIIETRLEANEVKYPYLQKLEVLPTAKEVPIIIPTFNNPTYSRQLFHQFVLKGFEKIEFVDNNSDSLEMKKFLAEMAREGAIVTRLLSNLGPRKSPLQSKFLNESPSWFCITDPDLRLNPMLPDDFVSVLADIAARFRYPKVGFALDISRPQDMRSDFVVVNGVKYSILEWEQQFWREPFGMTSTGDTIFKAPIDTTFALYQARRFKMSGFTRALRVSGRYTATHIPWLNDLALNNDEEQHYRRTQKFSYYLS